MKERVLDRKTDSDCAETHPAYSWQQLNTLKYTSATQVGLLIESKIEDLYIMRLTTSPLFFFQFSLCKASVDSFDSSIALWL